jgi:hypothetical protein
MADRHQPKMRTRSKNKKPAREQIPNDHLSPGRLKSDRLAGCSRRLTACESRVLRKGERGVVRGNPLALWRGAVQKPETTIASGVASYKFFAASVNSSRSLLLLSRCRTRLVGIANRMPEPDRMPQESGSDPRAGARPSPQVQAPTGDYVSKEML